MDSTSGGYWRWSNREQKEIAGAVSLIQNLDSVENKKNFWRSLMLTMEASECDPVSDPIQVPKTGEDIHALSKEGSFYSTPAVVVARSRWRSGVAGSSDLSNAARSPDFKGNAPNYKCLLFFTIVWAKLKIPAGLIQPKNDPSTTPRVRKLARFKPESDIMIIVNKREDLGNHARNEQESDPDKNGSLETGMEDLT